MRPAEGECDRLAASCIGDVLVGCISIALHDTAVVREQLEGVDCAATWRVAVGGGGRVGPGAGGVITGDRPEVSFLGAAAAGIEHRTTVSSIAILTEARISSRKRR